jgi:hypothetical protein
MKKSLVLGTFSFDPPNGFLTGMEMEVNPD